MIFFQYHAYVIEELIYYLYMKRGTHKKNINNKLHMKRKKS